MYRVELKAVTSSLISCVLKVPNVPCGVESIKLVCVYMREHGFLMYRVELKEISFLRRRSLRSVPNVPCGVERKVFFTSGWVIKMVPNVPCGVESLPLQNT